MILIRDACKNDFSEVFPLIKKLWNYNSYNEAQTRAVFERIISGEKSFAFIAEDSAHGTCAGFCHGDFFPTLWMCGETCYLSGIITAENCRHRGIGTAMINEVKAISLVRGCRTIILESGMARAEAHRFYESRGFSKSCFGFDLLL